MLRKLGFGLELLAADDALERPQDWRGNVVLGAEKKQVNQVGLSFE